MVRDARLRRAPHHEADQLMDVIQNRLLTLSLNRPIVPQSRPICEGRLISVVRCWGGERWLVGALEMRRKHPVSGPSRLVPARQPRVAGVECVFARSVSCKIRDTTGWSRRLGREAHESPVAVDRQPANSKGEAGVPETVRPPGALRSKPINTARGKPKVRQLRDGDACVYSKTIMHRVTGLL